MRIIKQRFTIINMHRPYKSTINEDLQWLGSSLGLFSLRDKDKSCFRIFIELLKSAKRHQGLSSDEMAARLKLSRGTIIFHINKLASTGIVINDKNKYMLRVDSLKELINEIDKDLNRTMDRLKEVGDKIDEQLGS